MKKLLFIALAGTLLSSCAFHSGTISSGPIEKRVVYTDMAVGVAQTQKLFGIGGISKDALVLEAKRKLVQNRPLQGDEQYVNYTIDFKTSFWPFYSQTIATVSADVVTPASAETKDLYSDNYKKKLFAPTFNNDLFGVGDTIVYDNYFKGQILSFESKNKVRIMYRTQNDKIRTKIVSIYDIYTQLKEYKTYKLGGNFYFDKVNSGGGTKVINGKIWAVGLKSVLVYDYNNKLCKEDIKQ